MVQKTSAARKQNSRKAREEKTVKKNAGYACDVCGKVVSLKKARNCKQTDLVCCGKSMTEHEDYFD